MLYIVCNKGEVMTFTKGGAKNIGVFHSLFIEAYLWFFEQFDDPGEDKTIIYLSQEQKRSQIQYPCKVDPLG